MAKSCNVMNKKNQMYIFYLSFFYTEKTRLHLQIKSDTKPRAQWKSNK
jgi:hypothetical protein